VSLDKQRGENVTQEETQETFENKNEKEEDKKKKWIVRIGILVLLIIVLLLLLSRCGCGCRCDTEDGRIVQGVIDIPESYDIQGEVDRAVEEGMFRIFINANISVKPNGSANLLIQNDAENHYPVYVTITHNEELLYKSDIIRPGYKLESDKINFDFSPGVYECVAAFHVLDKGQSNEINSINCLVKLTKEY